MVLRARNVRLQKQFNRGVSYKSGYIGDKLFDALNVLIIQNKLQTRYGLKRFSPDALSTTPQSLSFYVNNDSSIRSLIVKAGTSLLSYNTDAVVSTISSTLSSGTKHDAVTMNGRHIIAVESDGLFSWNGTTIAALGIDDPSAPTIAAQNGAGTLTDKAYVVAITYEAETTGFETNIGDSSNTITTAGGDDALNVTAIPVSTHPLVTHKNIYLKNTTDAGNFLFVAQIANATTTHQITANPATTAATPPTTHEPPIAGGAKYLAIFNGQLVYAGNSTFPNDVFFSEPDEPDAFDVEAGTIVTAQGNGPVTGLGVGYYASDQLNQFLAIFKRRSLTIYYEDTSGNSTITLIQGVGSVSHKSIVAKDGMIYFLSDYGWRRIKNGVLEKETLGDGDVDDIFKVAGWTYGVNKTELDNSFAIYYPEMDSYMGWVAEGSQSTFDKCYNYHVDLGEWMPLQMSASCAVVGEDVDGNQTVYIGAPDRKLYKYDIRNPFFDEIVGEGFTLDIDQLDIDVLTDDLSRSISCFAIHQWTPDSDFATTYNFRDYIIEAISDTTEARSTATVKAFINFDRGTVYDHTYNFYSQTGFILDQSMLDVNILADDRSRVRVFTDLNLTAENILIGIFQDVEGARLQLLAHQLEYNKNGNRNF